MVRKISFIAKMPPRTRRKQSVHDEFDEFNGFVSDATRIELQELIRARQNTIIDQFNVFLKTECELKRELAMRAIKLIRLTEKQSKQFTKKFMKVLPKDEMQ
jgi:hypothetical protein